MSSIPTQIANTFDFWLSFSLGGAIMVAAVGFYTAGKVLLAAGKERTPVREAGRGPSPERGDIRIAVALGILGGEYAGLCADGVLFGARFSLVDHRALRLCVDADLLVHRHADDRPDRVRRRE